RLPGERYVPHRDRVSAPPAPPPPTGPPPPNRWQRARARWADRRALPGPRVDPVPRLGFGLAVVGGVSEGGDRRLGPGLGVGEAGLLAVLRRSPARGQARAYSLIE